MKPTVIVTLVLAIFLSCAKDPFSTRKSEPPISRAGTFIPPTTPQIVLENLRFSYKEQVISNFIQSLDSNFQFRFDFISGAQTDSSWGYAREVNITEKLFNDIIAFRASRSLEVEFSTVSGQQDVILDTTALLVRSYVLTLSDSTSKAVSVYQGVARFELAESAFNFWAITQWRDFHADLETRSWAELKNAYR